jgi:hypothetical protein
MLSTAGLAGVRADLDSLRARLDTMVATTGGTRPAVPAPRAPAANEREPLLLIGSDQGKPPGHDASGTAETIAWGLELPVLARRRFRGDSGCALADVGRRFQADDGLAARDPAAKVSALWRADLADDLAWQYVYESRAWGYAALRWLLVDPGGPVGTRQLSASGVNVGMGDVARLRAATGQVAEVARRSGAGQARQVLVKQLGTDADRLLHGRCSAQVNQELLAVTAEATLLAGCLTYACWPLAALAQAYFIQALSLARACRDSQLGAAILCAMSQQAVFNGHLDEARNLVSTALSATGGASTPGLSAHLRLLTARDHMHRGELTDCVRALKHAVTDLDCATPGRKPGWTRWFTEADPLLFALVLAAAYLAAGLPGPALDTQLLAQRLADRIQSPCAARHISEFERRVPERRD